MDALSTSTPLLRLGLQGHRILIVLKHGAVLLQHGAVGSLRWADEQLRAVSKVPESLRSGAAARGATGSSSRADGIQPAGVPYILYGMWRDAKSRFLFL